MLIGYEKLLDLVSRLAPIDRPEIRSGKIVFEDAIDVFTEESCGQQGEWGDPWVRIALRAGAILREALFAELESLFPFGAMRSILSRLPPDDSSPPMLFDAYYRFRSFINLPRRCRQTLCRQHDRNVQLNSLS
jgi:hypothetical protein